MKRNNKLNRLIKLLRSRPKNWGFTSKNISNILGIPESEARYYLKKLRDREYIIQIDNKRHYKLYIVKPRFIKHNSREKQVNKKQSQLPLF